MFPSDKTPNCLIQYKANRQLVYMNQGINGIRMNADKAVLENTAKIILFIEQTK